MGKYNMKMENLAKIYLENNPLEMEYDQREERIIEVPEEIYENTKENKNNNNIYHYMRMNPKFKNNDYSNLLCGLNLVNTNNSSTCFYVSDIKFTSGIHYFEISHFSYFQNIKIGLIDNNEKEFYFTLNEFLSSCVIKIDLDNFLCKIYQKNNQIINSISLPENSYQLFIKVDNIGNFVSMNPFFAPKNFNSVWNINLEKFFYNLTELDENVFINNLSDDIKEMIQKKEIFVKGNEENQI